MDLFAKRIDRARKLLRDGWRDRCDASEQWSPDSGPLAFPEPAGEPSQARLHGLRVNRTTSIADRPSTPLGLAFADFGSCLSAPSPPTAPPLQQTMMYL